MAHSALAIYFHMQIFPEKWKPDVECKPSDIIIIIQRAGKSQRVHAFTFVLA